MQFVVSEGLQSLCTAKPPVWMTCWKVLTGQHSRKEEKKSDFALMKAMFVETLEKRGRQTTRRKKGEEATSTMTMTTTITSVVLDCCRCILDSPTLTPAFTSRLDILLVTDKLLVGVMTLTHHAHRSQHPEPQLTATAASLQEFVLATLFHESHHKLFKSYLDAVTKPGEDTQLPWAISNLFSKISAPLQCNMTGAMGRVVKATDF
ncbi:hypothetical protein ACOMHN_055056 [Nucella lapillus]